MSSTMVEPPGSRVCAAPPGLLAAFVFQSCRMVSTAVFRGARSLVTISQTRRCFTFGIVVTQHVSEVSHTAPGYLGVSPPGLARRVASRLGDDFQAPLYGMAAHVIRQVVIVAFAFGVRLHVGDGVEHVPKAIGRGGARHQNTWTRFKERSL